MTANASTGARLTVRDNGRGISPEFLPYVFERFRQADASSTRREGGLGLGLALVRELVELHGGKVTAHSDGPGYGSEFVVSLPLSASPPPSGAPPNPLPPPAATSWRARSRALSVIAGRSPSSPPCPSGNGDTP